LIGPKLVNRFRYETVTPSLAYTDVVATHLTAKCHSEGIVSLGQMLDGQSVRDVQYWTARDGSSEN